MSPKQCGRCGSQGKCFDGRPKPDTKPTYFWRRYRCPCGYKWTTEERFARTG